ncbi:MAG: NRDE family protein, partial [Candidatus Eiseniibacteriota bacterium]
MPLTRGEGLHIVAGMCTLIIGRDVVAPGTVLLAANRDEDPARPSDPPAVLRETPRLIGGRDRRAGGTWLAVRESRAVVAILNRRDRSGEPAPPAPDRRSRGALVLEVAAAGEDDLGRAVAAADAPADLSHAVR